jgi:hypothetical protein
MNEVLASCRVVIAGPDRVTRRRRATHVGFVALPIVAFLIFGAIRISVVGSLLDPDTEDLSYFLHVLQQREDGMPVSDLTAHEQDALEVYVAGHYGPKLRDPRTWNSPGGQLASKHGLVDLILQRHPVVSVPQVEEASALLKKVLDDRQESNAATPQLAWWDTPASVAGFLLISIVIPALLSAVVVRGGLVLNGLGMTVVRNDGTEISRLHSFARGLVAWSPILVLLAVNVIFYATLFNGPDFSRSRAWFNWILEHDGLEWASLIAVAIVGIGACLAILTPERGLQDRLTGTWVVPK